MSKNQNNVLIWSIYKVESEKGKAEWQNGRMAEQKHNR